jgi:hypothetical protein
MKNEKKKKTTTKQFLKMALSLSLSAASISQTGASGVTQHCPRRTSAGNSNVKLIFIDDSLSLSLLQVYLRLVPAV